MRGDKQVALILSGLTFLLAGAAIGADGVQVKVTNDGTEDIVVTVYDMSTNPGHVVLANARINGFTTVPLLLSGDATGRANLAWTATNADAVSPKCGHDTIELSNDGAVSVHADSTCSV